MSASHAETLDKRELFCLSKAIYSESRGEPLTGQLAVAHVVLNRVKSPLYPKTICRVVHQPAQFSDIEKIQPDFKSKQWKTAMQVAVLSYAGIFVSPVKGAKWFFNPKKVKKPKRWPSTHVVTIGNHSFWDSDKL